MHFDFNMKRFKDILSPHLLYNKSKIHEIEILTGAVPHIYFNNEIPKAIYKILQIHFKTLSERDRYNILLRLLNNFT